MYPVGKVRYDVVLQAANNEDNFIRLPTKYRNSINFHLLLLLFLLFLARNNTITTLFPSRHIVFPIDIYYALLTGYRPTHTSAPPPSYSLTVLFAFHLFTFHRFVCDGSTHSIIKLRSVWP